MEIILKHYPPKRIKKKFCATVDGKKIYFGAVGYEDFTTGHHDEKRKKQYISRHRANEE